MEIFPYTATSLPPADQRALERGIYLNTEAELTELLEDYLS